MPRSGCASPRPSPRRGRRDRGRRDARRTFQRSPSIRSCSNKADRGPHAAGAPRVDIGSFAPGYIGLCAPATERLRSVASWPWPRYATNLDPVATECWSLLGNRRSGTPRAPAWMVNRKIFPSTSSSNTAARHSGTAEGTKLVSAAMTTRCRSRRTETPPDEGWERNRRGDRRRTGYR